MPAFHDLLSLCSAFYVQDDNTTVIADGFGVLNALKETHLLLTEGAHNQYGDLPWTARVEMLMYQWVLARPEMRDFLPRRTMVVYPEPWIGPILSTPSSVQRAVQCCDEVLYLMSKSQVSTSASTVSPVCRCHRRDEGQTR